MDDTGFFSIEVIIRALKVWNLDVLNFNSSDEMAKSARLDPTSQNAYICNFKEHWFAIRRIGKQFFNLNSLLSFPELLSPSFIHLFLTQLQQEGYSIFIILGNLPRCESDEILSNRTVTQVNKPKIISNDELKKPKTSDQSTTAAAASTPPPQTNSMPIEDDCISIAIQQSLLESNKEYDENLKAAINMSLKNMQEQASTSFKEDQSLDGLTEEQLEQLAIRMSMENN